MRAYVASWPTLIAAAVGTVGVGVLLTSAPTMDIYFHSLHRSECVRASLGALFLILSYPLARRREWARRVLLASAIVIGMYFVFSAFRKP